MNIVVLCPHFEPDVAPTGEVMTSIAYELVALGPRLLRGDHRPARAGPRAGHVATADPRVGRVVGGPGPPGALRVQHPGRVPRRGGRARPAHRSQGDRGRVVARAGDLPQVRRGDG